MKITVCIGSSCHIKGSRQVVERLQDLIRENKLETRLNLRERSAWVNASRAFA